MFPTSILVLGRGSRPSPTRRSHICLPPSQRRRLGWPSGTRTPSVHYVDKPRTHGETMPSPVFVEAIVFAVAMLYETQFMVSPVTAALSKNWGSSLPELPIMETPLLLPSRSSRRRPQPPADIWGFSRSPWAFTGLGLLHQQWPVPVHLVHSMCSFWRQLERAGPVAWGFLSSWPSHESRSSAPLSSTEASLACAQRISSTLHW